MQTKNSRLAVLFTLSCLAISASAEIKVEEKVVGPAPEGVPSYAVSSNGVHFAILTMKGSRSLVVVDGVEGPLFDQLFDPSGHGVVTANGAVVFSPDGSRHAYLTRVGNEFMVVVDGKDFYRGKYGITALSYGQLQFSPGGKHVYFVEIQMQSGSRGGWRLVMDGKAGPLSGHQTINPVFSSDDSRWAYAAKKFDSTSDDYFNVLDGKETGTTGYRLMFTGDNHLISYQPATAKSQEVLLLDGKPAIKAVSFSEKIWAATTGPHWAVVAQKTAGGVPVLFVDGKEVPGAEKPEHVIFSPDGKRYLAICRTAAGASYVVTDGKKGVEYQGVNPQYARFTPDSSKAIYVAGSGTKSFVVVEGQESDGFSMLMGQYNQLAFSEKGGHYGYITGDGSNRKFTTVVDGKQIPLGTKWPWGSSLEFSENGSRYAFVAGQVGRNDIRGLVVDGEDVPDVQLTEIGRFASMEQWAKFFVFSPDGKHIAYSGIRSNDNRYMLFVDRKVAFISPRGGYYFLNFTPDSQHLVWAMQEKDDEHPYPHFRVFVDGQPTVKFNEQEFTKYPGSWQIGDDGALQFIAFAGDVTKRYRIAPTSDTGIDSMIAATEAAQAKALADAEAARKQAEEEVAKKKADAEAAAAKAKADAAAAAAKRKADYEAAVAAKIKARQDAIKAKQEAAAAARAARLKK